jgi:protein transport protein SEC31
MVRLREIPRTAAFAWSPNATSSWIVTGTKSGAVDVDFSNETCLELWDLALDEPRKELQPTTTITTETGYANQDNSNIASWILTAWQIP